MYFIQETDKPKILSQLFSIIKIENDKIIIPMIFQKNKKNEKTETKDNEKKIKIKDKI